MIVKFIIRFEDIMAIQKNSIKTSKYHKKKRLLLTVIGSIGVLLYLLSTISYITFINFLHATFWAIVFFIIFPFVYYFMNLIRMRYYLKRKDLGHMQGECQLTVNNDKLLKENGKLREEANWKDIQRVSEDKERFFFYLSDSKVFMIKKSPLNMNPQEREQYRQYIYSNINQNNINEKR